MRISDWSSDVCSSDLRNGHSLTAIENIMNFELDTTQCLLRDTLDSFLAKQYRFDARRKAVLGEPGWQPLLWRRFAHEMGRLGAGLPEQVGGSGGGAVEDMVGVEGVGKGRGEGRG